MKLYINKGYEMTASLVFKPEDVEVIKDPPELPDVIRGYQVRIATKNNSDITIHGRAEEIVALIDFLRGARIEVIKQANAEADP